MSSGQKVRYDIDLATYEGASDSADIESRTIVPSDREALAHLMLDAYVGTIDYEGETITEAFDAVDEWFAGSSLLSHSFVAATDARPVSAVLAMWIDDAPLIGIVMTHPDYKNVGYGRAVTHRALKSMASEGHDRVVLYITDGNTPSERMFSALGAKPTTTN
ncbi:MAG: GNAT family N-acetyltransferase [Acidimicrobiia bacterium]